MLTKLLTKLHAVKPLKFLVANYFILEKVSSSIFPSTLVYVRRYATLSLSLPSPLRARSSYSFSLHERNLRVFRSVYVCVFVRFYYYPPRNNGCATSFISRQLRQGDREIARSSICSFERCFAVSIKIINRLEKFNKERYYTTTLFS